MSSPDPKHQEDIAIIGMACLFPGAPDLDTYWRNIVSKTDAVTDPPPDAWDLDLFYDPNSTANDRLYCKRGGFIGPLAHFDPLANGVMPLAVEGGEPDQWLALQLARAALFDAGYREEIAERRRTAVILGKGTYLNAGNLSAVRHGGIVDQTLRILEKLHPEYSEADLQLIRHDLKRGLPPFNADTAPGLIPNIIAGRIANRLDLMGPTYTVDAACASSLVAVDQAVRCLRHREYDLALVGGVHVGTPAPTLMLFCQLGALSRREQIRPFDKDADGTILGAGLGVVVLKRREDAERDGNRIYALVKAVAVSSDGHGMSVMAPRLEGEVLALEQAYEAAGISPRTIGLIEAHGTGTPVGDATEVKALSQVFGARNEALPWCALGSVKSNIGHAMPAAGIAGLIKTALALYHKVLPPTLNVEQPHPSLELAETPFYINTETRPWIHGSLATPRRAGVNAFGFGGINAHAILEEYPLADESAVQSHPMPWDTEVCILSARSRAELIQKGQQLQHFLKARPQLQLKDLAYSLNVPLEAAPLRLAMVASTIEDLRQKLERALERLADTQCRKIQQVQGIYFFDQPLRASGQLAFLFPGEGSQYVNMLADLCIHFPEVRRSFDAMDRVFAKHSRNYVPSDFIFPRPAFSAAERAAADKRLWQMEGAFEAVMTASWALFNLLSRLEIQPDAILGHSTGEYAAMLASGIITLDDEPQIARFAMELNQFYYRQLAEGEVPRAALVAVGADFETVSASLAPGSNLYLAMDNCPHQTVIVGNQEDVTQLVERLHSRGVICERLPFDRPYHTPLFEAYSERLRSFFCRWIVSAPRIRTYSCTTMAPFPGQPAEIRDLAVRHWMSPVEFRKTIESMYQDGVRIFVEVGPRGNLSSFVDDILRGRPHLAVPANLMNRPGISQLNHLVGLLAAHGVPLNLEHLYRRRSPRKFDWDRPDAAEAASRKKTVPMKLAIGWTPMELSAETAALLRSKSNTAAGAAASLGTAKKSERERSLFSPTGHQAALPATAGGVVTNSSAVAPSPPPALGGRGQAKPEHRSPASPGGTEPAELLMSSYWGTMEQFLAVQENVMQAFLNGRRLSPPRTAHPADSSPTRPSRPVSPQAPLPATTDFTGARPGEPGNIESGLPPGRVEKSLLPASSSFPPMPFIGKVLSLTPGQELVALHEMDLSEDLFLRDHALGHRVSTIEPELAGLAVMPLTMSMEMMAEVAAVLMPDQRLVGMRDIRGYRWIALDRNKVTLKLVARVNPAGGEVGVQVFEADDTGECQGPNAAPIIEGRMIFAEAYPEPSVVGDFPLQGERPSKWTPEGLYKEIMFHGPAFRGVTSIDRWGEDGAEATLEVLPPTGLFRSSKKPHLVTDPVLLDQPGQVVGFWIAEHLETGYIVFPFLLEELQLYGPNRGAHERVKCRARIALVGDQQVRSDLEIVGSNGHLLARFAGWRDRRFDLPRPFLRFLHSPGEVMLARPWPAALAPWQGRGGGLQAYRLALDSFPDGIFTAHGGLWQRALACLVLGHRERELWRNLKTPERRRLAWLLGRVAAKDALRHYLKERHGLELFPADIEILPDEKGRPLAQGAWTREVAGVPLLSLSHSGGVAVAVVGDADASGLGVDVEHTGHLAEGTEQIAFSPKEQALLASADSKESWPLRLWCAKEAAAKALGQGMVGGPQALVIEQFDTETGKVQVRLDGEMARRFPAIDVPALAAHTARDGELVIATCLRTPDAAEGTGA